MSIDAMYRLGMVTGFMFGAGFMMAIVLLIVAMHSRKHK